MCPTARRASTRRLRGQPDLPVYVVPDVSSEERNWLLRHASVVLYLTSAEGFGLVPHEAAAFGTPTVFVPFGPLGERFPDLPAAPADWSLEELAKATDMLLRDPALARQQIEAIARDTERYDWEHTAAGVSGCLSGGARQAGRVTNPTPEDGHMTHTSQPTDDASLREEIDRLSLEQALRDFEVANARVVDLTQRLISANDKVVDQQRELDSSASRWPNSVPYTRPCGDPLRSGSPTRSGRCATPSASEDGPTASPLRGHCLQRR